MLVLENATASKHVRGREGGSGGGVGYLSLLSLPYLIVFCKLFSDYFSLLLSDGDERLSCLRCTLVRRQRTRGHTPRWMLYGGLLETKRKIRHLPSTAKHFFSTCFFGGSAVIRPVGTPARRSWVRPGPSAVPVAFVADRVEPSFNCHTHRWFI